MALSKRSRLCVFLSSSYLAMEQPAMFMLQTKLDMMFTGLESRSVIRSRRLA